MKFILLALFALPSTLWAQTPQELKSLDLSQDKMIDAGPVQSTTYVYQGRSFPLKNRFEVNLGGAQNISSNGFLTSRQVTVALGYHLNEDWGFRLQYASVNNKFNDSAEKLYAAQGVLPDVDYAKTRIDLMAEYSLFYGKFRYSKDLVNYFDLLAGAGVAQNQMNSGSKIGPVVSAAMAFWIKPMSYRLMVKDYIHQEENFSSSETANNVHGAIEVGYVF